MRYDKNLGMQDQDASSFPHMLFLHACCTCLRVKSEPIISLRMLKKHSTSSVVLLPLSPFKVSHQNMQGLLCEATYAMNGPGKRKLIHQNSIGIVSTDWCNHLLTSRWLKSLCLCQGIKSSRMYSSKSVLNCFRSSLLRPRSSQARLQLLMTRMYLASSKCPFCSIKVSISLLKSLSTTWIHFRHQLEQDK